MNQIATKFLRHRHLLMLTGAAILLIFFGAVFGGSKLKSSIIDTIDTSTYQAINLDNEMTYFGKITAAEDDFTTITDVFYFLDETRKKLVKRGEDSMTINNDHVLTAENLEQDSAVVKAILKYHENKK